MEPIITERLEITEAKLSDAPFIYELMNSSGWIQFIGDRGIKKLSDAENYIQNNLISNYQKNGFGLYKVSLKKEGIPIGICGFVQRDYLDAPDLGFAILPDFEGKGYTTEAGKTIIKLGFHQLKFKTIYGITNPANTKSINILTKLGLTKIDSITNPQGEPLLVFERRELVGNGY